MRRLGRLWLAMTFVVAAFATSAALYGRLPAIIPTHWSAAGVVDGWMPKSEGAFVAPGTALVIFVFLVLIEPRPTDEDPETRLKVRHYPVLVAAVSGFIFYVNAVVLMAGMGVHLDTPSHAAIAVGLLLIVLGNSLGKVPRNGVIGVRTPWTLADEEVWGRTHRVAGWLFVLAGVVTTLTGLMGHQMIPGLIAIGAAAAVSIGYSYVISRRINRGNGGIHR